MARTPSAAGLLVGLLFASLCAGCAVSDPAASPAAGRPAGPRPGAQSVLLTETPAPTGSSYKVVGFLKVERLWYGTADSAKRALAERARKIGADAVVDVKTWFAVGLFAWAAPHASGTAIRLTDPSGIDLVALQGQWY